MFHAPISRVRVLALSTLLFTGFAPAIALSQETAAESATPPAENSKTSPSDVVATVNGADITEADLALTLQQFAQELSGAPEPVARQLAARFMIEMKLMVTAAEAAGVAEREAFQQRLDFWRDQALRQTYIDEEITGKISTEQLQEAYEATISDFEPKTEINARHILVKTEDEAKAIIDELNGGADFAKLAEEKSIGPSAPRGGSLGFFGRGQMVAPFEEAAFALDAGDVTSEPVQTQFGWHVIKVDEKRDTAPPSLAELEAELRGELQRTRYQSQLESLREDADIVYVDESLKLESESAD